MTDTKTSTKKSTAKKNMTTINSVNKSAIIIMLVAGGFLIGVNFPRILEIPKYFSQRRFYLEEITPNSLNNVLAKKDFTMINVHTPYEGEIAHTDAFIPYDEMKANEASLPKDKNTPIVL